MRRVLLVSVLLCCAFAGTVHAADEDPQEQLTKAAADDPGSSWIFGGGVAVRDPGYVGYTRQLTPFPLIFYHYGRFFFAGINAGYLLSNGPHYRFSLTVQPIFDRLRASDSPQLAGMETRQWSLTGGGNLELFGEWGRLNVGLFHDLLGRNDGTGGHLGYQYTFHAGGWGFTPGVGLRWQDASLVDYYYGVRPQEARPGRPAYSPGSALNPYVSFGVSTSLTEHWQFRGDIQYMRFGSAIRNSPIVGRSGSPSLFIGFIYNPQERASRLGML